ncbi:PREDICTED: uncharacterized protein LOC105620838 [Atta cephalotes]|uniref:Uncharacterized protein n=1 Tax=Atta cephalotes TaxID=12957 RepID=A0A158NJJ7_ATTCE|nr:PREDICTED: uncharacterized protein LOC105620838 [Atta cephalotes]
MSSEDCRSSSTTSSGNIDQTRNTSGRRMSHFKEYKFFRSFSAKVENWPMRKAETLWRRMRERKIAGKKGYKEEPGVKAASETLNPLRKYAPHFKTHPITIK